MAREDAQSQYGGGSYSSSENRSDRGQSYGGGNNNRETYRTSNAYKVASKKAAEIAAKNKIKQDMVDFKNYSYQPPSGFAKFSPIAQAINITGLGKKTFEVNKSFYERNVIGKTNPVTGKAYAASIEDYQGYMSGRGAGTVDAYGREVSNTGNGGGSYVVEKNIGGKTLLTTAPTTAEVSQSKATELEDSIELRKKRVIAKGRSPTIMTGVTGATGGLTLGAPSLLGRA